MEVLEIVVDVKDLIKRERYWQEKYNVVDNPEYFNLAKAGEKFTSNNKKWYHHPTTKRKMLCVVGKQPHEFVLGQKPRESTYAVKIKRTEFRQGDPRLNQIRSNTCKKSVKRGADHRDCKLWILQDPHGNIHTAIGLKPFCEKMGVRPNALQYNASIPKETRGPIGRGSLKGWKVLDVSVSKHT